MENLFQSGNGNEIFFPTSQSITKCTKWTQRVLRILYGIKKYGDTPRTIYDNFRRNKRHTITPQGVRYENSEDYDKDREYRIVSLKINKKFFIQTEWEI